MNDLFVEDLRKWVAEKWVDIGAPKKGGGYKPCGRSKGEKRKGYPKCVPASKAASMSKGEKRSAVSRKRAAGNTGPKPNQQTWLHLQKEKKLTREKYVLVERLLQKENLKFIRLRTQTCMHRLFVAAK
jgi:hypothetical protein